MSPLGGLFDIKPSGHQAPAIYFGRNTAKKKKKGGRVCQSHRGLVCKTSVSPKLARSPMTNPIINPSGEKYGWLTSDPNISPEALATSIAPIIDVIGLHLVESARASAAATSTVIPVVCRKCHCADVAEATNRVER